MSKELWTQNQYLGDTSNHVRKRAKDTKDLNQTRYRKRKIGLNLSLGLK